MVQGIVLTVASGVAVASIGGSIAWALSVERRLNVERRVEALEEKLAPLWIEHQVEEELREMGITVASELPVDDLPVEMLREDAAEEYDQFQMEQQEWTKGRK